MPSGVIPYHLVPLSWFANGLQKCLGIQGEKRTPALLLDRGSDLRFAFGCLVPGPHNGVRTRAPGVPVHGPLAHDVLARGLRADHYRGAPVDAGVLQHVERAPGVGRDGLGENDVEYCA